MNTLSNAKSYSALIDPNAKLGQNAYFQGLIKEFIRRHNLAAEELTEGQLAVVLEQVLASGDIIKLLRVMDNGQKIIYVPYAEVERLRNRIQYLEQCLKENHLSNLADLTLVQ